ncbi:hypothetical protein [Pseudorhodoferax sp. Leaf274]|uniref:hypothetical protein n=1 Tax=Pseudorhodoferax sp. Leaf274 TaxID=1736318 RepID=UPI0012E28271|nr:hypothetical protein [Pseudorhodoferax sp. Leaf274]
MPDQTPSMPPLPALLDAIGMYGAARASGSGPDTAESWQKVQAAIKSYAQAVADERVRADRLAGPAHHLRGRRVPQQGGS